jgi:hypothetical protein
MGIVLVRLVAAFAVKQDADAALSAFGREHPVAREERRMMAHVLPVAAFKLGYPVAFIVPVEPCDPTLQPDRTPVRQKSNFGTRRLRLT